MTAPFPSFQDVGMITPEGQEEAYERAIDSAYAFIAECRKLSPDSSMRFANPSAAISADKEIHAAFASVKLIVEALTRSGIHQHEAVFSALMATTCECALISPKVQTPRDVHGAAKALPTLFEKVILSTVLNIAATQNGPCPCPECTARREAKKGK